MATSAEPSAAPERPQANNVRSLPRRRRVPVLRRIGRWFRGRIGIDLGTVNTVVYVEGRGIVFNEPTVIAYREGSRKPLAIGRQAQEMVGRTPGDIRIVHPLQDGVIAHFGATADLLSHLLRRVRPRLFPFLFKPVLLIGSPSLATQVEQKALQEAGRLAGAREVFIIEEPLAAAIGAGLPIIEPYGSMIVDIGGGTSDVAILSCGGLAVKKMTRVGGVEIDRRIAAYLRREFRMMAGSQSIERLKHEIGWAIEPPEDTAYTIRGRSLVTGMPVETTVRARELHLILREPLQEIATAIHQAIEQCPPELVADIQTSGILLSGGGALLKGLDALVERETGVRTYTAANALTSVAEGTSQALDFVQMQGDRARIRFPA